MRDGKRWLRAALAALALAMLSLPQPATAHPVPMTKNWISGGQQGFCVNASVQQEHAWHSNFTWASNCFDGGRIRTNHYQYESFYKVVNWGQPGVHCFNNGWHSDAGTLDMNRFYPWDIGNWCNNSGQWLHVTIDSWQYADRPGVGSFGGALRPATWHCHGP